MANYSNILAEIVSQIYTNDNEEITGAVLQNVLLDLVASLGTGYQYMGVAQTSTNPGTPDQKVFYLAGAGTYTHFGNLTIAEGRIGAMKYNGAWSVESVEVGEQIEIVNNLTQGGSDKALSAEMGKQLYGMFGSPTGQTAIFTNSASAAWETGNIYAGGLDPYANQRIIFAVPAAAKAIGTATVRFGPSATFSLKVCTSANQTTGFADAHTFNTSVTEQTATIDISSANYIGLVLYDQPSSAQAKAIPITVEYYYESSDDYVLRKSSIVNNLTEGGTEKVLSAEMGKQLKNMIGDQPVPTAEDFFTASSGTWVSGNIANGRPANYANKIAAVAVPESVKMSGKFHAFKASSTYKLNIYTSNDLATMTELASDLTSVDADYTIGDVNYIVLMLWDLPSEAQAKAQNIKLSVTRKGILTQADIITPDDDGLVIGESVFEHLERSLSYKELTAPIWGDGGLDGATGAESANGKRTGPIPVKNGDKVYIRHSCPIGFELIIWVYNSSGTAVTRLMPQSFDTPYTISLGTSDGWIRVGVYNLEGFIYYNNLTSDIDLRVYVPVEFTKDVYTNPVIPGDFPDPTVWDGEDGYWYLLPTNNTYNLGSAKMFRSANLVDWEEVNDTPFVNVSEVRTALGGDYFWAPTVFKLASGVWRMILCIPEGGLVVLSSNHPTFGYSYEASFGEAGFQLIDPEYVYDRDGSLWLLAGAGTIYIRRMTDDGLAFAEGSSWTAIAGNNVGVGRIEAVMPVRRGGYWYLLASSENWINASYHIVAVRSASLAGPYVNKAGSEALSGNVTDVLTSLNASDNNAYIYGPGHNAALVHDRRNRDWIIYHAHVKGESGRAVCIDEIVWGSDGWPVARYKHPLGSNEWPSTL